MITYIERFEALKQEIEALDFLEIKEYKVNRPASEKTLKEVEALLEAPLEPAIRSFYEEANGLKLRWSIREKLPKEEFDRLAKEYDDYTFEFPDNEDAPFAFIHLLKLEDSILKSNWPEIEIEVGIDTFQFGKKEYPYMEFARQLKPFDLYSLSGCMAFFLEKGNGNPKVLQLTDYYIEWDSSRVTDFASYLEMILATKGILEARYDIYSEYRGDKKKPLVTPSSYWKPKHIPKMFHKKPKGSSK